MAEDVCDAVNKRKKKKAQKMHGITGVVYSQLSCTKAGKSMLQASEQDCAHPGCQN